MNRFVGCAAAILLAASVAACENSGAGGPGASLATQARPQAPAVPESPVPSAYVREVLKQAAPDPVAALPEQVKPVALAGTWSGDIIRRIADLAYTAMGSPTDGTGEFVASNEYLPASLDLAGGKEQARRFLPPADKLGALESCLRVDTSCWMAYDAAMASALTRLGAGDRAGAEAIYQAVLHDWPQIDADIRNHCYQNLGDEFGRTFQMRICRQYELRAAYEGLTDRADALVASSHAARALATHPDIELPYDVVEHDLALIRLRGKLRELGRIVDLVSSDRSLDYIIVAQAAIDEADRQAASPGGRANAINLLAIAARLPARYSHASAEWRSYMGLALDCRVAALEAQKPETRASAAAQFAGLLDRYDRVASDGRGIGYCLYRLAPTVEQTAARPRILARMDKLREAQAAKIEKDAREAASVWLSQGFPERSHEILNGMIYQKQLAEPRERLLIDPQAYRNALLGMLDTSKDLDAAERLSTYLDVVFLAEWYELHQF